MLKKPGARKPSILQAMFRDFRGFGGGLLG